VIIERLDLIAFGRFSDQVIDLSAGPVRFHLVYGPNESGKSTSMRAIHSLLFGMPMRSDDDYIHPYKSMRIGGKFRDATSGDVIECVRRRGRQKTLLTPDEKTEIDPSRLSAMLRGVDAETFSRQFGLSHHELVSGGRAILEGGGDLGEMLFAAGTGTGTLRAVRQQLEKDCRELFVKGGSSGTLNRWIAKYQENEKRIRELRLLPITYEAKIKEFDQAVADADAMQSRLAEQTASLRRLRAFQTALSLLPDRRAVLEQIAAIPPNTPNLDESFTNRRRVLEGEWIAASQLVTAQREQLADLAVRRDALVVDQRWLAVAPTVKQLMNELGEIESAQLAIAGYRQDLKTNGRQIDDLIERFGQDLADSPARPTLVAGISSDGQTDGTQTDPAQIDPAQTDVDNGLSIHRLAISDPVRLEIDTLVTRYGGLVEKRQTAEDAELSLRETLQRIDAQIGSLPPVPDPKPLADAIAAIGNPRASIGHLADCQGDSGKAKRRVDSAFSKLRGYRGGIDELRRFVPPPASKIAEHADAISQAKRAQQVCEAQVVAEEKSLDEARSKRDADVDDSDLPTTADRDSARSDRDATMLQIRRQVMLGQTVDVESIESLGDQIRRVDQITDFLHLAHDRVVRRARLDDDVARASSRVEEARDKLASATERLAESTTAWNRLWESFDVDAGDPNEMRQWLADYETLRDLIDQWDDKREAIDRAGLSIARCCEQLVAALRMTAGADAKSIPVASAPNDDLLALHLTATTRLDDLVRRGQAHATLVAERQRCEKLYHQAVQDSQKCEREWERWQTQWAELTAPLAAAQQARPDTIHALIRIVDDLQALRSKREGLASLLAERQLKRDAYIERVGDIAARLSMPFNEQEFAHVVREISQQADKQLKLAGEQHLLEQQITSLEKKVAETVTVEDSLAGKLKLLCKEAGCESADQLPTVEQASAKLRELRRELAGIDQQLRALAESETIDDFILAASSHEPAAMEIEIDKADLGLRRSQEGWAELQQRVGKLRGEVERMDASDEAARMQQEQQNLLATIRRQANRFAELKIAEESLRLAIEHYRQHNEGPVLSRASRFFSRMTDGEYESLQIEFDEKDQPKLFGVRRNRQSPVAANLMSDGTADALYLSLRLASLEVHLDTHHPIPLIVDDCLIQFDDDRAAAALGILSDMANRTQVILFTHHQHLLDLAAEKLPADAYHVHRLDKADSTLFAL
jgi:uncharacterized protein YhaN